MAYIITLNSFVIFERRITDCWIDVMDRKMMYSWINKYECSEILVHPPYFMYTPHIFLSFVARVLSAIPRFFVEDLLKNLDFGYFVLIWWQTDEKQESPEAELQGCLFGQNCQLFD